MYAIVRRYAYDPAAIASAGQALAAAQELHTTQPGYAGPSSSTMGSISPPSTYGSQSTTRWPGARRSARRCNACSSH
jgi:hypothetical protein